MSNIVFDFDGTLANTTHFHKKGWERTFEDIGLNISLGEILEYKKKLLERYDSYERLVSGFQKNRKILNYLIEYYGTKEIDHIVQKLFNAKESYTIKQIETESSIENLNYLAVNLDKTLNYLLENNHKISILSSSRKSIVISFLSSVNLLSFFQEVITEEDLYDKDNKLKDKPSDFAAIVYRKRTKQNMDIYIGDSYVDEVFCKNAGIDYVFANYKTNIYKLIKKYDI